MSAEPPDIASLTGSEAVLPRSTAAAAPTGTLVMSPLQTTKPSIANRRKLFILPVRRSNDDSELSPRTLSESSGATAEPGSPTVSGMFRRTTGFFSPRTSSNLSAASGMRTPATSDLREADTGMLLALETAVTSSEARSDMVAHLLGEHRLDLVLRVRFASAVHELMRATDEPDREFIHRAKKLVEVFFDAKSKFRLEDNTLPAALVNEMHAASTANHLEAVLIRARERVLNDLLKSDVVRHRLEIASALVTSD